MNINDIVLKYANGGKLASHLAATKKGIASLLIAGSLMTGSIAEARNVVPVGKNVPVTTKQFRLQRLAHHVALSAESDPLKQTALEKWLQEVPIHESGQLRHRRQVITEKYLGFDKKKKMMAIKKRNVEKGAARSIFGIELPTASDLVKSKLTTHNTENLLASAAGTSVKKLKTFNKNKLGELLMSNDMFAATMAVAKARDITRRTGEGIPVTIEDRAAWTAHGYNAGKHQAKYEADYLADDLAWGKRLSKESKALKDKLASKVSTVMKKHIPVKKTAGKVQQLSRTKIASKGGTATSKAMKFLGKTIRG